jgi:hypothetical protein
MYIAEWYWSDHNRAKLARHGVRPEDVIDVWDNEPKYRPNKKNRAATHQMIGPNWGGAFLAVAIKQVIDNDDQPDGLWMAVTGWPAEPHERAWWDH